MVLEQVVSPLAGHSYGWVRALVAVTVFLVTSSGSMAGDDPLGAPAMASAVDPDSLVAPTVNPSALTVGTQNPGPLTAPTTALPAPVETQSPSSLVVPTESPADLAGQTRNLEDLPDAATSDNAVRQAVAARVAKSQPQVAAPQTLSAARSQLAASQAALDRVNSAIGTMLERDYPTGEARLQLYDEQKAARQRVTASKGWVQRFEDGSGGFSE